MVDFCVFGDFISHTTIKHKIYYAFTMKPQEGLHTKRSAVLCKINVSQLFPLHCVCEFL